MLLVTSYLPVERNQLLAPAALPLNLQDELSAEALKQDLS